MTTTLHIHEVYTRQWLHGLTRRKGREIDLYAVPEDELEAWQQHGVTHAWLMGIWPTGPQSRRQAIQHAELRRAYHDALPGWSDVDVVGSPYAISAYHLPPAIGGEQGLASLRGRLRERHIKVILDFVCNHTGLDHSWATMRPHLYVGAPTEIGEAVRVKGSLGERWIAHGKDPYFPGWTDTLQLDYRRHDTRKAMIDTLLQVANRCDGVRCDMAMLALNDVFAKTWAHVPAMNQHGQPIEPIDEEFWSAAIAAVKARHPDFIFIAEAYWGLEDRLLELGFDFAYDKTLYDHVVHGHGAAITPHLRALGHALHRRVFFLENHDEPRAAHRLDVDAHRAAALLTFALPGAHLVHEGEREGRKRFARIQLGRTADEPRDATVEAIYASVTKALQDTAVGRGAVHIVQTRGWDDNPTHRHMTLLQWQRPDDANAFELVVVNSSPARAQCRALLTTHDLSTGTWSLQDRLGNEHHTRSGEELAADGLFLDVGPWAAQVFSFRRS